ncbi:MAG: FecR domain-containing protein [Pseudomonadota bacterium]
MSKIPEEALQQAYDWHARAVGRDLSVSERHEFEAWLASDVRHRAAYDKAVSVWQLLGQIPRDRYPTSSYSAEGGEANADTGRQGRVRLRLKPPVAVAVAACIALAGFFIADSRQQVVPTNYSTAVARIAEYTLPDGSRLVLGASSSVSVMLEKSARYARLLSGEAYFEIAPDRERPFTVESGSLQIGVVGTAFSVTRQGENTRVTVAEGTVAVRAQSGGFMRAHPPESFSQSVTLKAGQRIETKQGRLKPPTTVEVANIAAWRSGRLLFTDATLVEIISVVDRYHSGSITITDSAAEDLTLTLGVDVNDIDGLLANLEAALPITIRCFHGGDCLISSLRESKAF